MPREHRFANVCVGLLLASPGKKENYFIKKSYEFLTDLCEPDPIIEKDAMDYLRHAPFRFIAAIIGFFVFLSGGAPLAAQSLGSCNGYVPAIIDIQANYDDVQYDVTEPMVKIKDIAEGSKEGGKKENWPVGLSTGQMYFRLVTDIFKMRSGFDPSTCGQVKAVHLEMGFHDNMIYVAKELPRRSCPFKVVMEHEEKHKKVDRELLEEYTGKMRSALARASEEIGIVRKTAGQEVEQELSSHINQVVDHLSKEMQSEREIRQKKVDSEQEYDRISGSCDGQLMEIVNERLKLLEDTTPGITRTNDDSTKKVQYISPDPDRTHMQ